MRRFALRAATLIPLRLRQRISAAQFHHPALARAIARVRSHVADHIVTIPAGPAAGLRIRPGTTNLGYALGSTEPEVHQLLADRLKPGGVFYDIGANVGYFALSAARLVGAAGSVVAFEPVAQTAERLRENVRLNDFGNVRVVQAAVSDRPGRAQLSIEGSALEHRLVRDEPAGLSTVEVEVVSIDDGVRHHDWPVPSMIKVDAEGFEAEVLEGARSVLIEHRPMLVCELHGTQATCLPLLRSLGYTVFPVDDPNAAHDEHRSLSHVLAMPGSDPPSALPAA